MARAGPRRDIIRGMVRLNRDGFVPLFAAWCLVAGLLIATGVSAGITDNDDYVDRDWLIFLSPVASSGLAVATGASTGRGFPRQLTVVVLVLVTIAAAIGWANVERDDDVSDAGFIGGVLFGAVAGTALPLVAYYWLGRKLASRQFLLFGLWVVSLAALYTYLFFVVLGTSSAISCGGHDYDQCPRPSPGAVSLR